MSEPVSAAPRRDTGDTHWYRVAEVGELADGMLKRVVVADKVLVLIRVGDRYGALDNRCAHMGGPLAEGTVENGLLVCPWHGREYDPQSGRCEGYAEAVRAYPVEQRSDGIYAAV